jgi:hypothetical protein
MLASCLPRQVREFWNSIVALETLRPRYITVLSVVCGLSHSVFIVFRLSSVFVALCAVEYRVCCR